MQYESVVTKILQSEENKRSFSSSQEDALSAYVIKVGFLNNLPPDSSSIGKVARSHLVPEPGYFDEKLVALTDDQQAEYVAAFGAQTTLGAVTKYFYVRLHSLLETAIVHPSDGRLDEIEKECRFLSALVDRSWWSYTYLATKVADIVRFLADLDPPEREQRRRYLRDLESDPVPKGEIRGHAVYQAGEYAVRLTGRYFDLVRLPIAELQRVWSARH
jgi:hypothetical protein